MSAHQAHFTDHPLYQNGTLCGAVSDQLLADGHTVLQLFQMDGNEEAHSLWLMDLADPKCKAKTVLSLGCGVGGVEAYWKRARPELEFELVNISQEQLDRCLCEGRKICDNAETYHSDHGPFDIVSLCYMLGHVNRSLTLLSALGNLDRGGRLLIYDVFEGSDRFRKDLFYDTPRFSELEIFGTAHGLRFRVIIEEAGGLPLVDFVAKLAPWIAKEAWPGLFVFERP